MDYTKPAITRLGTVADVTQKDDLALAYDGHLFRGDAEPVTS